MRRIVTNRRRMVVAAATVGILIVQPGMSAYGANATFDGNAAVGTAGNNTAWSNAANWTTDSNVDTAPTDTAPGDDLTFGGGTAGGIIDLGTARVANSLTFNQNYTLGLASTTLVLTNTSGTITVNSGVTGTINAVLAGTNGINLSGGGTLLLNRATGNTFTGNITVDGAGTTLAYVGTNSSADPTALGAAGARTITLTNGGAVSVASGTLSNPTATTKSFVIGTGGGTIDTAASQTLQLDDAGQFSGTGNLTKTGAGTLFLNNQAFTYTGAAVNVNAGTLRVGANAGVLGAGTVPITVASGATLDSLIALSGTKNLTISGTGVGGNGALVASGTGAFAGTVTMVGDTAFGGAGTLTVSNVVSGGFNLSKVGTGTTILNGTNTYTGNTTISGGAIRAAFGTGLPSTTNVSLNGGAIELAANYADTLDTTPGKVQIPGGASGFSSALAAGINVNLNGGATIVWGSTPNFSPSALVLNQPSALGPITFQNAIDLNGAPRTFAGNGPLASPGIVSGPITSTGGPVAVTIGNGGTGVIQFTNTGNTGIASITLASGQLGYSTDDNLGGATTPITFDGGGLQFVGTGITAFPGTRPVTYNASRAIGFDVAATGHTVTVSSSFPATTTTFTKNGPGTLALSAASGQFVTLQMNGGTLDLGSGNYTLANGGNPILQSTGGGTINGTGALTLSSTSATDGGNVGTANGTTLTINVRIASTGTGAFEAFAANNGTGVVALTNLANSFTGNVIVNSGVVAAPAIGASGAVGPLGTGNTISLGTSNVSTGTLRYTGTGESTNRTINLRGTTSGGTLDMSGTGTFNLTANLTSGAGAKTLTLTGSTAGIGQISGVIPNNSGTNTTAVSKSGSGVWVLSGANTYTGTTTISGGTLRANDGVGLPTGSLLTINGGVFETGANLTRAIGTAAGQVQLTGGTSGFSASGANVNVNLGGAGGQITWGGTTFNPSSLVLNGPAATHTVTFQNDIALGTTARTIAVNAGSYDQPGVISGIISGGVAAGSNSLTKSGAVSGNLILSGVNTFTGNVTVSAGGLTITNASALGTGTKTIVLSAGTAGTPQLQLDGSGGDIVLPANFTYLTSVNTNPNVGALVNLAGNNTIQGTINPTSGGGDTGVVVQQGSLTIAANVTTATTGLGTRNLRLRGPGTGTLSGVISNGSSTVGLFQEGSGTWRVTNNNTFNGGVSVTAGTLLANTPTGGTGSFGASAVTISATGTLGGTGNTGTGAVTVNAGGTINPGISLGTLSIAGPLTFGNTGTGAAPTYLAEIQSAIAPVAGVDNDLLTLTGAAAAGVLNLSNDDRLNLVALDDITGPATYTIATFASSTGAFNTVLVNGLATQNIDPGAANYALVTYNSTNIEVTVANLAAVPEPATAGLLAAAGVGLLGRRRRRATMASRA